MISRRIARDVSSRLGLFPAVALLGPRQVGKTTLARAIADSRESVYLDLENPNHARKLGDPARYLFAHEKRLVVLDEVQRIPGLFEILRGIIDEGRRRGSSTGRFLMSGSRNSSTRSASSPRSEAIADQFAAALGPSSEAFNFLSASWSRMTTAATFLDPPAKPLERLSAQHECVLGVTPPSPEGLGDHRRPDPLRPPSEI